MGKQLPVENIDQFGANRRFIIGLFLSTVTIVYLVLLYRHHDFHTHHFISVFFLVFFSMLCFLQSKARVCVFLSAADRKEIQGKPVKMESDHSCKHLRNRASHILLRAAFYAFCATLVMILIEK